MELQKIISLSFSVPGSHSSNRRSLRKSVLSRSLVAGTFEDIPAVSARSSKNKDDEPVELDENENNIPGSSIRISMSTARARSSNSNTADLKTGVSRTTPRVPHQPCPSSELSFSPITSSPETRTQPLRSCLFPDTYNLTEQSRLSIGYAPIRSTPLSIRRTQGTGVRNLSGGNSRTFRTPLTGKNFGEDSQATTALGMVTARSSLERELDSLGEEYFTPRGRLNYSLCTPSVSSSEKRSAQKVRRRSMTEKQVVQAMFETDTENREPLWTPTIIVTDVPGETTKSILKSRGLSTLKKQVHFGNSSAKESREEDIKNRGSPLLLL